VGQAQEARQRASSHMAERAPDEGPKQNN